jgi:ABC-type sugar transport system ATPase subunit
MSVTVAGERTSIWAAANGDGAQVGTDCIIGIRPEHFALSAEGELTGTVVATEMLGSETIVFANLPSGETITVSVRGICSLSPGTPAGFSVDSRFVHVFDGRGHTLPPLRPWREDYLET